MVLLVVSMSFIPLLKKGKDQKVQFPNYY
jgi:hypothetical protein